MDECSICLDELVGSIVVLDCKHKYHDICIGSWYESNIKNTAYFVCPLCNLVTDIETIINVEPLEININLKNYNNQDNQIHSRIENNYTTIPITNMDPEIEDDIELTRKKCIRCTIL